MIAAAQEERFTRKKHDSRFPRHAIDYCLAEAGIGPDQLDFVAFYDKPLAKFERLLETYLAFAPVGFTRFDSRFRSGCERSSICHGRWTRASTASTAADTSSRSITNHTRPALSFRRHFDEAAILTVDGVGEWATATYGIGRGNHIELTHELRFPHSLGLLYSAFTYYTGFKVNSGEYKVMGLAPYGEPRFTHMILEHLLDLKAGWLVPHGHELFQLLPGPHDDRRRSSTSCSRARLAEAGIAAHAARDGHRGLVQAVTDEIMVRMARHVARESRE